MNRTRTALLIAATVGLTGLSGCATDGYGYGGGYGYVGYADAGPSVYGYGCDPWAPFSAYYTCDAGYGFANFGYGGGWAGNYYYPGYGVYVFDREGHRRRMDDDDRGYWAHRRAEWARHATGSGPAFQAGHAHWAPSYRPGGWAPRQGGGPMPHAVAPSAGRHWAAPPPNANGYHARRR